MNYHISATEYRDDLLLASLWVALVAWFTGFHPAWFGGLVSGFVIWTIAEWAIHRYVFHDLFRVAHAEHHRNPQGDTGVPLWMTQPAVLAIGALLILALGSVLGGGLFCGFTIGYVLYNVVHMMIHKGQFPAGGIVRRHQLHHRGVAANYNVLIPLGDLLFGTYRSA